MNVLVRILQHGVQRSPRIADEKIVSSQMTCTVSGVSYMYSAAMEQDYNHAL